MIRVPSTLGPSTPKKITVIGVLHPEDDDAVILRNFWNYTVTDSITSPHLRRV